MNTIQSRIRAAEYFSSDGLSISNLKRMKLSPLHYRAGLEMSGRTPAMQLGTAAHCATLEPERFLSDYAIWDKLTAAGAASPRRGKEFDAFVEANPGKEIILASEAAACAAIAKAVREDPVASKYLRMGEPEVVMKWEGESGRLCRGRVDWVTAAEGPILVGLKTARSVMHFGFSSQCAKLGYHLQWAWYHDGYQTITGVNPRMVEIAVESAPPHAVVVYLIPEDIIEQGRDEYRALLERLAWCEANDQWPGPAETEQVLTLPSWVYGPEDDDISELGLEE